MAVSHKHIHTPVAGKIGLGILLSAVILVAEIVGGILSHSLALLADAGHVAADVIALSLSWYGIRQAQRPPNGRMTFGFHRVGVLVALVNALSILAIAVFILYEAFRRFQSPTEVNSGLMTLVACIGLAVNVFVALRLRAESHTNLNVRSAFWHATGDAMASIGVIAGGIIIALTGLNIADPIVSVLISVIIVLAAWDIFRDGLHVLLEAAPGHLDTNTVSRSIGLLPGVQEVHDIHVWSITPEIHAMSAHVLVKGPDVKRLDTIRQTIEAMLKNKYSIIHTTLQMECRGCGDGEAECQLCVRSETEHQNAKRD
jgi:cobalt-zinc-cadmium efflux system protein